MNTLLKEKYSKYENLENLFDFFSTTKKRLCVQNKEIGKKMKFVKPMFFFTNFFSLCEKYLFTFNKLDAFFNFSLKNQKD